MGSTPRMFMRGMNAPPGGLSFIGDITRLSPFVTRILGKNPSAFTLQGTNTYLVGAPNAKARVLIDTGDAFSSAAYTPLLLKAMRELNVSNIAAIILTHHHADHVGGVHAVLKALSQKDSSAKQEPVPVFKMKFPGDDATFVDVNDGDILHTDGTLKRNGTTVASAASTRTSLCDSCTRQDIPKITYRCFSRRSRAYSREIVSSARARQCSAIYRHT